MNIVTKNINDIKPYEFNAKLHPKEQIEQIKNSILEFGNNDPIAIDLNNVIIEGHGRYEALKQLEYKEVEVIVLDLNEEQKKAYRLIHNQLTMNTDWDMDMLKEELNKIDIDMSLFGMEELMNEIEEDLLEAKEDDFDVDSAIDEINEPTSKLGDIYQLGNHRLMCGDSTNKEDVEKLMNDNKADLLLTDPPYNVSYQGGTKEALTIENDSMSSEEFKDFLTKAFTIAVENIKNGASFYIWYASKEHINFETALNDAGLNVRQQLIWNKNSMVLGRQDYQWKHEPCLYGWKDGANHNWYSDRTQTTVMNFNKPNRNGEHPTMKPLDLFGYLIKNSSVKNNIVLDLFGGSGSTLIACEQLNRKCYMMEYDPKYVDVIIKRWETLTGEKAVKLND